MDSKIVLQTMVKPSLYRGALMKGTLFGFLGAFLLVLVTILVPSEEMTYVGPFVGLLSLLLIGMGFRPFQKLKKQEMKPQKLILSKASLEWQGKTIDYSQLKNWHFVEEGLHYGIELVLSSGENLFLPYFSKRSFDELNEFLDDRLHTE